MIFRTVVLLLFYGLMILAVIPVLLVSAALGARWPVFAIGRWAMRASRVLLGLTIEVEGREHMAPAGPAVYMANHASFIDGPLLFLLIPRPVRIILKRGVFRIPVVGPGMRFAGFLPVDRKGRRRGRAAIERAARRISERGWSFLIFPEGTRSLDGRLGPFRRGGFFLATAARAAVVPVTIRGTFEIMPKGRIVPRCGPIRVVFHPAVPPRDGDPAALEGLMAEVRDRIASGFRP